MIGLEEEFPHTTGFERCPAVRFRGCIIAVFFFHGSNPRELSLFFNDCNLWSFLIVIQIFTKGT